MSKKIRRRSGKVRQLKKDRRPNHWATLTLSNVVTAVKLMGGRHRFVCALFVSQTVRCWTENATRNVSSTRTWWNSTVPVCLDSMSAWEELLVAVSLIIIVIIITTIIIISVLTRLTERSHEANKIAVKSNVFMKLQRSVLTLHDEEWRRSETVHVGVVRFVRGRSWCTAWSEGCSVCAEKGSRLSASVAGWNSEAYCKLIQAEQYTDVSRHRLSAALAISSSTKNILPLPPFSRPLSFSLHIWCYWWPYTFPLPSPKLPILCRVGR